MILGGKIDYGLGKYVCDRYLELTIALNDIIPSSYFHVLGRLLLTWSLVLMKVHAEPLKITVAAESNVLEGEIPRAEMLRNVATSMIQDTTMLKVGETAAQYLLRNFSQCVVVFEDTNVKLFQCVLIQT